MDELNWDKILDRVPSGRRADVKAIIEKDHKGVLTTDHPVVIDEDGFLRFVADPFSRWLYLVAIPSINGQMFLADAVGESKRSVQLGGPRWDIERVKQQYRDFGITLSAFSVVFANDGPWAHLGTVSNE